MFIQRQKWAATFKNKITQKQYPRQLYPPLLSVWGITLVYIYRILRRLPFKTERLLKLKTRRKRAIVRERNRLKCFTHIFL